VVVNVLMLGWLTMSWVIFLFPITLVVSIVSIIIGVRCRLQRAAVGYEEHAVQWRWIAPTVLTLAILLWGAFFLSPEITPPAVTPWYVWPIAMLLLSEAVISVAIVARSRGSRQLVMAAVLPQLWLGVVASFIAWWGVTSGGTLGAL
jgi:hypothetical protein